MIRNYYTVVRSVRAYPHTYTYVGIRHSAHVIWRVYGSGVRTLSRSIRGVQINFHATTTTYVRISAQIVKFICVRRATAIRSEITNFFQVPFLLPLQKKEKKQYRVRNRIDDVRSLARYVQYVQYVLYVTNEFEENAPFLFSHVGRRRRQRCVYTYTTGSKGGEEKNRRHRSERFQN